MKKNIEWLRREVPNLRGYAVVIDDEDGKWEPITTVSVKDVLELINQLDEPEALSQEWIDKYVVHVRGLGDIIEAEAVENLLVPKQELPVIPKFVADFIKVRKGTDAYSLKYILCVAVERSEQEECTKAYDWISANDELFARAWLDGYTVEEEQKYIVRLPSSMQDAFPIVALGRTDKGNLSVRKNRVGTNLTLHDKYQLTEQEIKDYDPRYMTFAEPVEELEE